MQNHTEFLPLRKNAARQAELHEFSQRAASSWSSRPDVKALLEELGRYGEGADLGSCPVLERALSEHDLARKFVGEFSREMVEMLDNEPFAHPDFGHHAASGVSTIQLGKSGRAELSVTCFAARSTGPDDIRSMRFFDCERYEMVLAGSGEALSAEYNPEAPPPQKINSNAHSVRSGQVFCSQQDGVLSARAYTNIPQRLVVLRLVRQPAAPQPTREISLQDGSLVGQSSGDKRSSTREVMMVALGRMKRADAVPAMAGIARSGSEQLRWEAIRQCLALDVAQSFALLSESARSSDDPLHGPASALRAQLIEAHPQLAQLEHEPCPA